MAFIYDRAQYRTYDAARRLTFHLSNPNKEQEATLSLLHDDGSGVIALAFPRNPSPALKAKINALNASRGDAWTVAMPPADFTLTRLGDSWYSKSALVALLQEGADAQGQGKVREGEIGLCELVFEF